MEHFSWSGFAVLFCIVAIAIIGIFVFAEFIPWSKIFGENNLNNNEEVQDE